MIEYSVEEAINLIKDELETATYVAVESIFLLLFFFKNPIPTYKIDFRPT